MFIYESHLSTFEATYIFWGSWDSSKNWLEPETKPSKGVKLVQIFEMLCRIPLPSVILKAFCLKRECHLHQHYKKLFCTKVFSAAFMCLHLGFVGFCQKEISEKSTLKMLLKLTIGVNFTNNLWAAFLNKSVTA